MDGAIGVVTDAVCGGGNERYERKILAGKYSAMPSRVRRPMHANSGRRICWKAALGNYTDLAERARAQRMMSAAAFILSAEIIASLKCAMGCATLWRDLPL